VRAVDIDDMDLNLPGEEEEEGTTEQVGSRVTNSTCKRQGVQEAEGVHRAMAC